MRVTTFIVAVLLIGVSDGNAQDNTVIHATSQARAHHLPLLINGGTPKNGDQQRQVIVLINQAYAVGFSEDRKAPLWSAYHVDRVSINQGSQPTGHMIRHDRPDDFYTDLRTTSRVDGQSTFGSDFDRGHMTPNNAIQQEFGRLAQLETFLMSNIIPQVDDLNSGMWRTLEHRITTDLVTEWNDVWVIAGPIYGSNPSTIGSDNVPLPNEVYMIILEQTGRFGRRDADVIAFRFPNNEAGLAGKSLPDFIVTVADIEAATNLDFFHERHDEATIEAATGDFDVWFP